MEHQECLPRRFPDEGGSDLGLDMRQRVPWHRQYSVLLE